MINYTYFSSTKLLFILYKVLEEWEKSPNFYCPKLIKQWFFLVVKLYSFYIVCNTGKIAYIRHRIKNKAIYYSEKKKKVVKEMCRNCESNGY